MHKNCAMLTFLKNDIDNKKLQKILNPLHTVFETYKCVEQPGIIISIALSFNTKPTIYVMYSIK